MLGKLPSNSLVIFFCHGITETQLIIHLSTTVDVTKYSLWGKKGPVTEDSVVERKVTQWFQRLLLH